jgi:hypothetical protein
MRLNIYRVRYQIVTVTTYEAEVTAQTVDDVPNHVLAGDVTREVCINVHEPNDPRNIEVCGIIEENVSQDEEV